MIKCNHNTTLRLSQIIFFISPRDLSILVYVELNMFRIEVNISSFVFDKMSDVTARVCHRQYRKSQRAKLYFMLQQNLSWQLWYRSRAFTEGRGFPKYLLKSFSDWLVRTLQLECKHAFKKLKESSFHVAEHGGRCSQNVEPTEKFRPRSICCSWDSHQCFAH